MTVIWVQCSTCCLTALPWGTVKFCDWRTLISGHLSFVTLTMVGGARLPEKGSVCLADHKAPRKVLKWQSSPSSHSSCHLPHPALPLPMVLPVDIGSSS